MRLAYLAVLTIIPANVVYGDVVRSEIPWTVTENFEKSKSAREALSGAACVTGTSQCLAVNDEKNYAQFFEIIDQTIAPQEIIRLLPDEVDGVEMDEIDAEGVAYSPAAAEDDSFFYVVGSHGLSRTGSLQPSRFFLIRFPVDPVTGRPSFTFGDNDPGPEISRTSLLRIALQEVKDLQPYAEQKLDRNGITIEGIAVQGQEVLLGLRSPCLDQSAFIVRASVNDLFKDAVPVITSEKLELGDNVGIRDLTTVGTGVLILAGRSDDDRGDQLETCGEQRTPPHPTPQVWFWNGKPGDGTVKLLGALPGTTATDSAETLLVLEETEQSYRVLVMFDGVVNGDPVEFLIDK